MDSVEDLVGSKMLDLSESDSDMMSCGTASSRGASRAASPGMWAKRRRSEDEEEDDGGPSPKVPSSRRGRGRPPTTGQYVGLAKAKADYNEALREQERLEAEAELAEEVRRKRKAAAAFLKDPPKDGPAAPQIEGCDIVEIGRLLEDSMETVTSIATKSRNLKGTSVRGLKEAAHIGKACVEVLRTRPASKEMSLLVATNNRLTTELELLRREMAELRAKVQPAQVAPAAPAPPRPPPAEDMMQAVMVQVGTMLNARLAGLEERLLPEKRVRPPLAADKRREEAAAAAIAVTSEPMEVIAPAAPSSSKEPKRAPKQGKKSGPSATQGEPSARPSAVEQAWTEVVGRSSRRNKAPKQPRAASQTARPKPTARSAPPARPKPAKKAKAAKEVAKAPKLRPPRTAAVVISLQPGAAEKGLTYAKVVAEAKARIDLGALGVSTKARMRTAATGAKIIEVPGAEKSEQADSLAEKLREVFQGMDDIKISRPVLSADMRVSGLDDSVESPELVEALAKAGGCPTDAIKAGPIRRSAASMGTAFVRCPATAAKQIVASGRLLVGWVSAQVRLLEPRPRRCFRCLAMGHIRAQCRAEVDRSDECYRCGQKGHKASGCSAAPHCTLCAAVGKSAAHLSGSKACAKPPAKQARRTPAVTEAQAQSQPARSTTEQAAVRMEES